MHVKTRYKGNMKASMYKNNGKYNVSGKNKIKKSFKKSKFKVGDKVKFTDKDWKKMYPGTYEIGFINPSENKVKLQDNKTKQRIGGDKWFNMSSIKKV